MRRAPAYSLAVIGGLVAGPSWPLRKRNTHVGRSSDSDVLIDDPTVSWHHCIASTERGGGIEIADRGSRNGTWIGEQPVLAPTSVPPGLPIRLGAVRVAVGPSSTGDDLPAADVEPRSTSAGAVHLNRPPRHADPPPAEPIIAPPAPPPTPARVPLSLVALVAPLAFAALMVVVLGRLIFALFALLSPVLILGNWFESRRRARRTARSGSRRLTAEMVTFCAALEDRRRAEMERRWRTTPHPAELFRRARVPSVRLWERRPDHGDFLQLHVGIGSLPWTPPIATGGGKLPVEAGEAIAAAGLLREVPVPVDLKGGSVVGLAGDRRPALALARSLVLQAATLSGPADVHVAIFTDPDRAADWEWAKWLPHTIDAAGGALERLLAPDEETGDDLIGILLGAGLRRSASQTADARALTLVVVDAEGWIEGAGGRAVLRGDGGATSAIVLADATHRLPAVCTTVLELLGTHGEARLRHPHKADVVDGILAAGVDPAVAREWARQLARFEDLEVAVAGPGLVDTVSLASILDVDPFDVESVRARWRAGARNARPVTPIGVTRDGVLSVDLVDDGPHGLVVGTTGSGKSEVLRTLVAGLAVALDPSNINFLLFDYKGGRAFDQCARLPHVVGLVTDLDEQLGQRALRTLEAEIRHRERVLASADAVDMEEYTQFARDPARGLGPLPRLVVVVDEFARLSSELPRFVDSLVDVAQRGRGLGLHLLLGTQRPTGAVSASIKANTALRIVLRVEADGDSVETIGTSDAAFIPKGRPGRGFARLRSGKPIAFQAAQVSEMAASPGTLVEVQPFRFGPGSSAAGGESAGDGRGSSSKDLLRLVTVVNAAFATSGLQRPRRLWEDVSPAEAPRETIELPDLLGLEDIGSFNPLQHWRDRTRPDVLRVPIGLTADGAPLHLDLKESALGGMGPHGLVVGATGSGKSELLRTLVSALAITHPPELLSFVLVDFKGGATFAGMAELPHVAGLITNLEEDQASVDRMRDALFGELRRRQTLLQAAGDVAS
ncbi:MAG: FHA domain-containing protein, partial [Actinobacteria bacterium]|nr:FHA domain-containing protein [Actinomycetota bacterium]